jgi:hypothetical protein
VASGSSDLVRKHIDFHREMERTAEMIADGRYEEAARSISPASDFIRSSQALANAVMLYDGVAAIAVPA